MATDTILTPSMITQEALMVLENELTFAQGVDRQYDDRFAVTGAKIGDTLNVRRPARFIGASGPNLQVEDFNETSIPVVVGNRASYGDQFHVDTTFNTKDLTLAMDEFSDRFVKPAVATIANHIDVDGLTMAKNETFNIVGVPGTPPTGLITYLTAGAYLDAEAAPKDRKRQITIEPFTQAVIVDSLKGLFTPSTKLDSQFKTGMMGSDSGGMNWFMDQNVVSQTFGSYATTAGALTVNGANQGLASGWAFTSTLSIATSQTVTLNQGDTFQLASVFGVNPQSRKSYGKLRNFVVKQTVTSGAGNFNVVVSPALIYGGQFQNVTISPAASAVVTPFSIASTTAGAVSSFQNIMNHKNAFTLAMADLMLPDGVHFAGRASSKKSGMSVRIVRQYTINNDSLPCRIDTLYGWAPIYPELSVRVAG